jgi:hypothetical protein
VQVRRGVRASGRPRGAGAGGGACAGGPRLRSLPPNPAHLPRPCHLTLAKPANPHRSFRQVMNEGPGHVPLNKIPENMDKQLDWCRCGAGWVGPFRRLASPAEGGLCVERRGQPATSFDPVRPHLKARRAPRPSRSRPPARRPSTRSARWRPTSRPPTTTSHREAPPSAGVPPGSDLGPCFTLRRSAPPDACGPVPARPPARPPRRSSTPPPAHPLPSPRLPLPAARSALRRLAASAPRCCATSRPRSTWACPTGGGGRGEGRPAGRSGRDHQWLQAACQHGPASAPDAADGRRRTHLRAPPLSQNPTQGRCQGGRDRLLCPSSDPPPFRGPHLPL